MSSSAAAVLIRDFLRRHGGSASAGAVVAYAVEQGLAASTVRRAADECDVVKSRQGARFVWSLTVEPEADPVTEGGDVETMQRDVLEARARHLGVDLDEYPTELTDEELQAVIEDAEEGIFDGPGPVIEAPSPIPSKRRKAPSFC